LSSLGRDSIGEGASVDGIVVEGRSIVGVFQDVC
jgi:hypothetical protein